MEPNFSRFFLDFCAFVVTPSFYFKYFGINVTFKRGFFCDDPDLRYPKRDETYTGKVVWTVATIVPMMTILLHEAFTYFNRKQLSNRKLAKIYLLDVYKKLLVYTFGLMSVNLICNIFKYGIGRLRPHFFDSCRPVDPITGIDLSNCSNLESRYEYIENYVCSGQIENNIRLSFFSGHATVLSYQFIYFLLYTQNNMQLRKFGLIRPLIQTSHLVLSVYLILSRVFDYYHHPSDLIFGSVVGSIGSLLTYYFLSEYTESYWLKNSQFMYSYDDEQFADSAEQVDASDSEAQKIRKRPVGKDVVDVNKLRKTSTLVRTADEKTALLSSNKPELS